MAKAKGARKPRSAADERTENLARKIWLAGVGAYGKSFSEAHEQIDRAGQEASRLFTDLVERGLEIEDQTRDQLDEARERLRRDTRERIDDVRGKISGAKNRISEVTEFRTCSVDELICRVRERMGFDKAMVASLDRLSSRVENLADLVSGAMGVSKPKQSARGKTKSTAKVRAKAKTRSKAKPGPRKESGSVKKVAPGAK